MHPGRSFPPRRAFGRTSRHTFASAMCGILHQRPYSRLRSQPHSGLLCSDHLHNTEPSTADDTHKPQGSANKAWLFSRTTRRWKQLHNRALPSIITCEKDMCQSACVVKYFFLPTRDRCDAYFNYADPRRSLIHTMQLCSVPYWLSCINVGGKQSHTNANLTECRHKCPQPPSVMLCLYPGVEV